MHSLYYTVYCIQCVLSTLCTQRPMQLGWGAADWVLPHHSNSKGPPDARIHHLPARRGRTRARGPHTGQRGSPKPKSLQSEWKWAPSVRWRKLSAQLGALCRRPKCKVPEVWAQICRPTMGASGSSGLEEGASRGRAARVWLLESGCKSVAARRGPVSVCARREKDLSIYLLKREGRICLFPLVECVSFRVCFGATRACCALGSASCSRAKLPELRCGRATNERPVSGQLSSAQSKRAECSESVLSSSGRGRAELASRLHVLGVCEATCCDCCDCCDC